VGRGAGGVVVARVKSRSFVVVKEEGIATGVVSCGRGSWLR